MRWRKSSVMSGARPWDARGTPMVSGRPFPYARWITRFLREVANRHNSSDDCRVRAPVMKEWCVSPRLLAPRWVAIPCSCTWSWYSLFDRRYTTMWCNVYIMQQSTERHVSTLQGHHQFYKILVLTKVHAVELPTGSRGLQFNIWLNILCNKIGIKCRYDCITRVCVCVCLCVCLCVCVCVCVWRV